MKKLTKKELKEKKMRLKKMRELREQKVSKLKALDLSKLENVLQSKYHLSLKQFIVEEQDYFTMKIKDVSIEVRLDNKELKAGVLLGEMDLLNYETSELFSILDTINSADPLLNSTIQLEEMDNYYYLQLKEVLLNQHSTEAKIFDLLESLLTIAKSEVVSNALYKYIATYN